jgi:hypothetical protein
VAAVTAEWRGPDSSDGRADSAVPGRGGDGDDSGGGRGGGGVVPGDGGEGGRGAGR